MFLKVLCVIFPALHVYSTLKEIEPKVQTESFTVEGKRVLYEGRAIDRFLSIPFASPPVGDLRFRKTVPFEPHKNTTCKRTIKATHEPPACQQYLEQPIPFCDLMPGYNEDCLYLNIFAPVRRCRKHLTVMFYIYGGGYYCGSIRKEVFDAGTLAATGNVIVVTTNYRLGPLGFLYSNTTDAPGNMGLYDILEALKWVNRNIEFFGGNKDSITLFGQSVGAETVAMFTISPLTKGLYKRAIMQTFSAGYLSDKNAAANFESTEKLAKIVNCAHDDFSLDKKPREVVDCMKGIEASRLVKEARKMLPGSFISQSTEPLLPRHSLKLIRNSEFHQSELLIGFNANEGSVIVIRHPDLFGPLGKYEPNLNKSLAIKLLEDGELKIDRNRVINYYFGDLGEYDFSRIKQRYFLAVGDILATCNTMFFGDLFAKKNNVFFYVFDHRPSNSPWAPEDGVVHFDEVAFVFGEPVHFPKKYTLPENALSKRMMRYWTSFAKYGTPDKTWPLYRKFSHSVRVLNTTVPSPVEIVPSLKNCLFLRRDLSIYGE